MNYDNWWTRLVNITWRVANKPTGNIEQNLKKRFKNQSKFLSLAEEIWVEIRSLMDEIATLFFMNVVQHTFVKEVVHTQSFTRDRHN